MDLGRMVLAMCACLHSHAGEEAFKHQMVCIEVACDHTSYGLWCDYCLTCLTGTFQRVFVRESEVLTVVSLLAYGVLLSYDA